MPTVQEFREYIQHTKLKAADQGLSILEMSADGILQCVGHPFESFKDLDACRQAMEAERRPGDMTLKSRSREKMNLTIGYRI